MKEKNIMKGTGKGRKDLSKLVKKLVVDKNGVSRYVYVSVYDYILDKVQTILAALFGWNKKEITVKIREEYDKHRIRDKGITPAQWEKHFIEYFANKKKWDELLSKKSVAKVVVKNNNKSKGMNVKYRGVAGGKKKSGVNISIMRLLHNIYGGLKHEGHEYNDRQSKDAEHSIDESRIDKRADSTTAKTPQHAADRSEHLRDVSATGERPATAKRVTNTQIMNIRKQILDLLESKKDHEMTEDDKELLRQYEGQGGTKEEDKTVHGALYEFYTPKAVTTKVWDIVNRIFGETSSAKNRRILEPAAGIGRFVEGAKEGDKITMMEIDPISSRIAKILHPDKDVINKPFQEMFMENGIVRKKYSGEKYDIVVGNPPYGVYTGKYKGIGEGKEHSRYEEYFIDRSLDVVKDGGLVAFVVPSTWLRSKNDEIKEKIAKKGKLIAAYRLPNGTFSTTGVGTDIIVLRKEEGNVQALSDDKYFAENPQNILGIEKERTGKYGKMEKYVSLPEGENFETVLKRIDPAKLEIPKIGNKTITEEVKEKISVALKGNKNAEGSHDVKTVKGKKSKKELYRTYKKQKGSYTIEEFQNTYGKMFDNIDLAVWDAQKRDGSVEIDKLPKEIKNRFAKSGKACIMGGKYYHAITYAAGNVYEKLDILEKERTEIGEEQYRRQKEILEAAKPPVRPIETVILSPISHFVKNYRTSDDSTLFRKFIEWAGVRYNTEYEGNVTPHDLESGLAWNDIVDYMQGVPVRKERTSRYDTDATKDAKKQMAEIKKDKRRIVAQKLFMRFIKDLPSDEKAKMTEEYNRKFNAIAEPDYTRMPFYVSGMSKEFKGKELKINEIQLRGASFLANKGVGLLAYGVGAGKTMTGIMATVKNMQTGRSKRPVIIVPKATYWKWVGEIRDIFPDIKLNLLGNMSEKPEIKDGTLSIMTYEGLQTLTFKDETASTLLSEVTDAIMYETGNETERERALKEAKSEETAGRGMKAKRASYFVEEIGFDHVTVDEAHNFKNVFGRARVKDENKGEQKSNEFANITGSMSDRAAKLFMLTNYVMNNNHGRNVYMLTATPFTNSPLEIYNILSMMAMPRLKEMGINNLNEFMSHFVELKNEWVTTPKGTVERRDVVKSFKDLPALQALIREYIDFRTTKEAGIMTPKQKEIVVELPMTPKQKELVKQEQTRAEEAAMKKEADGAMLVAINNMRQLTLSPALYAAEEYHIVDDSPKLYFVAKAAGEIYKRKKVGQVIYMPRGVTHYEGVVESLVKEGIPRDAIAYIRADYPSQDKREEIIREFNDPNGKTKIIIGSETIKEGIDLNGNSAVLYNTFLDWNPSATVQVNGRITRQGNRQKNTFIVYPILNDSIDSAIYQKHDEKMSRFGEVWSYKGESLDVSDISPEELKYAIIKDPAKRADFKIKMLVQELEEKKREKRVQKDLIQQIVSLKKTLQEKIETTQEWIRYYEKSLAEKSDNDYVKDQIAKYKMKIRDINKKQKFVDERIQSMGLTSENINAKLIELDIQVEETHAKIEDIKKRREEYIQAAIREIEAEQKKVPSVEESVKNFVNSILPEMKSHEEEEMQKAFMTFKIIGKNHTLRCVII